MVVCSGVAFLTAVLITVEVGAVVVVEKVVVLAVVGGAVTVVVDSSSLFSFR